MKTKGFFPVILSTLFALIIAGCAGVGVGVARLPSHVPLPNDITIEAPGPDAPKKLIGSLGVWTGAWDGVVDIVFVVERLLPQGAQVIYARSGTNAGWWRTFAYLENDTTFRVEFFGMTMRFTIANGTLDGRLERRGQSHSATLWKVEGVATQPISVTVSAEDLAIIQKIASRSPWKGEWVAGSSGGTTSFEFYLKERRLEGNFLGASGSVYGSMTGPLKFVEFKKGKLTFVTPSGTSYEFRLTNGELKGELSLSGAPPGEVTLRPQN